MMGNRFCHVKLIFSPQPSRTFSVCRERCPPGGLKCTGLLAGLLLLFAFPTAFAQSQGCFTADVTRGCVPLTITLDTVCSNLTTQSFNFGDGTVFDPNKTAPEKFRTASITHTYTRPGRYTVTQYGQKKTSSGPTGDSLQKASYIEVLATPEPSFTVNTCSGRNLRVRITDTVYESYLVDFGDGTTRTLGRNGTADRTYADLAPRTITVTGQYAVTRSDNVPAVCGAANDTTVTPIAALPRPAISRLAVKDAATAELVFTVQPNTRYRVEQKNAAGQYQPVATLENPAPGPFTQPISGLATASQPYTFRVTAFNVCGNSVSSGEVSTVVLTAMAAESRNEVSWQADGTAAPGSYTLYVNNAALTTVAATQTRYTDADVRCPEQYCYRVEAAYPDGAVSVSNTGCVNAISTRQPPAVQNLTATVLNGVPVVSWTAEPGRNEYLVTRSTDGGPFEPVGRLGEAAFTDENARLDLRSYCYRVRYTDACNNASAESSETCPVRLQVEEGTGGDRLTWSPYREWAGGVTGYALEKLDATGRLLSSRAVRLATATTEPVDTTSQVIRYRVRVTGPGLESVSNEVEVRRPVRVFLPEAFTPNGDRFNDVYTVKGRFIAGLEMVIYDRWGNALFTADRIENGWDGTVNGQPAGAGTYVCLVRVVDQTGRRTTHRGAVLLIR
jgi:gliding motility-associated-like protein